MKEETRQLKIAGNAFKAFFKDGKFVSLFCSKCSLDGAGTMELMDWLVDLLGPQPDLAANAPSIPPLFPNGIPPVTSTPKEATVQQFPALEDRRAAVGGTDDEDLPQVVDMSAQLTPITMTFKRPKVKG